jgi:hypothetical protein
VTPDEHSIAHAVASRAILAALARAVLKGFGSDAFIYCEAQALSFVTPNDRKVPAHISAQAERIIEEIFQMADGVPESKP